MEIAKLGDIVEVEGKKYKAVPSVSGMLKGQAGCKECALLYCEECVKICPPGPYVCFIHYMEDNET